MREMKLRKQWLKKGIAMVIALAMVAGILPVVNLQDVFADEQGGTEAKYGKVEGLQNFYEVVIEDEDKSNVVVKNQSPARLQWYEKNESIGRNWDGWWFGIKITAPNDMLRKADFVKDSKQVKFRINGQEKNFWDYQDPNKDDAETIESGLRYMSVWGMMTPEYCKIWKQRGRKALTYSWEFDWDMDNAYEQKVTLELDPNQVTLLKNEQTEYDPNLIYDVMINNLEAPVVGKMLDTESSCPTTDVKTKSPEVKWYVNDSNTGSEASSTVPTTVSENKTEVTGKAEAGKSYTASVTLTAEAGKTFTESNAHKVNDKTNGVVATLGDDKKTLTVTCNFGQATAPAAEEKKNISKIEITDIDNPVVGKKLDQNATCTTTGIEGVEQNVVWKVNDNEVTGSANYSTTYTAYITLNKVEGYTIAENVTATINGQNATVTDKGDQTLTVSYTFPTTAPYVPQYLGPVATPTPEPTPTPTPTPEPTETPAPSASAEPSMEPISEEVTTSVGKEVETVVEEIVKGTDTTVVDETTATKIKEAVEQGKDIETEIVAEPVSEEKVDATEAKAIEETVKSLENTTNTTKTVTNVAQFINIEILIKAGGETLGNLTALKEPIKLKIAIPENLKADSRKFFVVRLHNGKVEKLDSVMNEDGTLTFSTDKFSTYALAYEDTVEVEKTVGKTKIGGTSRTTSSVTLPWSKVAGATKYRVYYKVNGAAKYTMAADTTSLKYTIKGLKSATTYKFAVKAFGYGKWSDVFATKITTTSPDKVAKTTVTPGSRKATVKYSKVARATGYEIYMAKGNGKYVKVKTTKSNSYVKTGLKKGATYKFRVRAFKKVGTNVYYGAFSSVKYAKVK